MTRIKNIKYLLYLLAFIMPADMVCAQQISAEGAKLLYADNFKTDKKNWIAEFEQPANSAMTIGKGKLEVSAAVGATIWYKNKLSGNIMITYHATVVDAGGKNDRVSDMNSFWMASNPLSDSIFKQDGKFSSYDNLHLYYAGIGGHDNTTTRFRKYAGDQGKKVLKEYTDKPHLLIGNHKYMVKIVVNNGIIQYYIDDVLFWEFQDVAPYKEGYFGFRTTTSHQLYDNFKVYQLK